MREICLSGSTRERDVTVIGLWPFNPSSLSTLLCFVGYSPFRVFRVFRGCPTNYFQNLIHYGRLVSFFIGFRILRGAYRAKSRHLSPPLPGM